MYVISTSKHTVLSQFPNLVEKCSYRHPGRDFIDLKCFGQHHLFVELNKGMGIDVLRLRQTQDDDVMIQRVRKIAIDNVYSVACANQTADELAFGLCNGQIKLYNYKDLKFTQRFDPEKMCTTVLALEYNCTDEYLASVYENGTVSIFGTKTKTRIDKLNFDGNVISTLFHPTKRLQLAFGCQAGNVYLYDIQSKRNIFQSNKLHEAPCRDLAMTPNLPDVLCTVGFDCVANVIDIRRRAQVLHLKEQHPLSSVAMSECGQFLCLGNLKGEVITYDCRATKYALATNKIHDGSVMRVAFMPPPKSNDRRSGGGSMPPVDVNCTFRLSSAGEDSDKSERTRSIYNGPRDSFMDMLDKKVQKSSGSGSSLMRQSKYRESFDWDALGPATSKADAMQRSGSNQSSKSRQTFDWDSLNMQNKSEQRRRCSAYPTVSPVESLNESSDGDDPIASNQFNRLSPSNPSSASNIGSKSSGSSDCYDRNKLNQRLAFNGNSNIDVKQELQYPAVPLKATSTKLNAKEENAMTSTPVDKRVESSLEKSSYTELFLPCLETAEASETASNGSKGSTVSNGSKGSTVSLASNQSSLNNYVSSSNKSDHSACSTYSIEFAPKIMYARDAIPMEPVVINNEPPVENNDKPRVKKENQCDCTENANLEVGSLSSELKAMRIEMNERFHLLESELKFACEGHKWNIFTHATNLWSTQTELSMKILENLTMIADRDPMFQEIRRLRKENMLLKGILSEEQKNQLFNETQQQSNNSK